ncbi:hypothetical protein GCM10027597_64120 [Saccharopolyspora tripterygii]
MSAVCCTASDAGGGAVAGRHVFDDLFVQQPVSSLEASEMNATQTGLISGLILGTAAAVGGFIGFLIALLIGVVGLVIGRILDGELDVSDLIGRAKDRQ